MEFHLTVRDGPPLDPRERLELSRVRLEDQDLARKGVRSVSVETSRLVGCRFERMRLRNAGFGGGREPSEYVECSFDRSRITAEAVGVARFVRCSFRDVVLRNWWCHGAEFVDCTFTGRIEKALFFGRVTHDEMRAALGRERNEFTGNDFRDAELVEVSFRQGIDLDQQTLPTGEDYVYLPEADRALRQARQQIVQWSNLEQRRDALIVLGILEGEVEYGQRQLLVRPADFWPKDRIRREAFRTALEAR